MPYSQMPTMPAGAAGGLGGGQPMPQQPMPQQMPQQQMPGLPAGVSPADFQNLVAGMAPPEREQFMRQLYADPSNAQMMIASKLREAKVMRDTATPEGRKAGNVYVAANPLEHLGAGLQRYQGKRDYEAGMDEWKDQQNRQADMLRKLSGMYTGVK